MIRNFFSCTVSLRAVKTDRFIKRLFEIDGKREINASLKVYIYIYIYILYIWIRPLRSSVMLEAVCIDTTNEEYVGGDRL